jgi:hypothetical protein
VGGGQQPQQLHAQRGAAAAQLRLCLRLGADGGRLEHLRVHWACLEAAPLVQVLVVVGAWDVGEWRRTKGTGRLQVAASSRGGTGPAAMGQSSGRVHAGRLHAAGASRRRRRRTAPGRSPRPLARSPPCRMSSPTECSLSGSPSGLTYIVYMDVLPAWRSCSCQISAGLPDRLVAPSGCQPSRLGSACGRVSGRAGAVRLRLRAYQGAPGGAAPDHSARVSALTEASGAPPLAPPLPPPPLATGPSPPCLNTLHSSLSMRG